MVAVVAANEDHPAGAVGDAEAEQLLRGVGGRLGISGIDDDVGKLHRQVASRQRRGLRRPGEEAENLAFRQFYQQALTAPGGKANAVKEVLVAQC